MRNILLLIATILTGCSIRLASEQEVINATFLEMVGTHYYNEPPPPSPYKPTHPDSLYNEIEGEVELTIELDGETYETKDSLTLAKEWDFERDSLLDEFNNFDWEQYKQDSTEWQKLLNNPKKDRRDIILLVYDSLIVPQLDYLDLSYKLTPEGFQSNFQLDDSWRLLALELLESDMNSLYLNLQELTNRGEYQLKSVGYEPLELDRIVATLKFSRVIFNEAKNHACYYYQEYCGRLCGYGYLVFVVRIDGKWRLKTKRQLWVS